MKIGIISGNVRDGSNTAQVAEWVYNFAKNRNDEGITYELLDLQSYNLPMHGTEVNEEQSASINKWKEDVASYDGYVIVTPEYNRAIPGFLKNALDYLHPEVHNKAVGYVSFGGIGGLSAIQNLRIINGEQALASVRGIVTFSLNVDFENFSVFKPKPYHENDANVMFDQLLSWSKALKTVRQD